MNTTKKMVIDYKGFDIDEVKRLADEIDAEVEANQFDNVLEFLGDAKVQQLETILADKGFLTTKEFRLMFGIAFSENMTGKMETITALSTSCLANKRCLARMMNGENICAYCFSAAFQAFKKNLRENTLQNFKILNEVVIPIKYWPLVCNDMLRFEAFGDLATWKQVANYFNCCEANPNSRCALWTKNPDIIAEAIEKGFKKPDNLIIIVSSLKVNEEIDLEELKRKYSFVDYIFTCFDKEYIKEHDVDINCGGRSCRGCADCYKEGSCPNRREIVK